MPFVMQTQPDQKHWIRYITTRIHNNKNFVGFVGGPTGSGKSWSCLTLGTDLDPNFSIKNVVFDARALMALINSDTLKPGAVIIFEEAGVGLSSKNWQSTLNKIINYLFQTFRHKRYILFLNSPYMDFIDASSRKMFHAEFKTIKIDKKENRTILKAQAIQYNDRKDKFYYKYLRVRGSGGMGIKVKTLALDKPRQDLIDAYEKKKTEFTSALNKEIEAQLMEKANKQEKAQFECKSCGHTWHPKGKLPSRCPKCGKNTTCEVTPPPFEDVCVKTGAPI
jgi:predicted Zn-ribbon and HTH transcriptional regulator